MKGPERKLEEKGNREVKGRGGVPLKGQGLGVADRLYFMPGARLIIVEWKAPGGSPRPTAHQKDWLLALRARGFEVYCLNDLDTFRRILDNPPGAVPCYEG